MAKVSYLTLFASLRFFGPSLHDVATLNSMSGSISGMLQGPLHTLSKKTIENQDLPYQLLRFPSASRTVTTHDRPYMACIPQFYVKITLVAHRTQLSATEREGEAHVLELHLSFGAKNATTGATITYMEPGCLIPHCTATDTPSRSGGPMPHIFRNGPCSLWVQ